MTTLDIPPNGITAFSSHVESKQYRKISKTTKKRNEDTLLQRKISDSTDSGNDENIPFVNTAECTATHNDRQLMHAIFPVNIDTLFATLYSNSKFLADFLDTKKYSDIVHNNWDINEDGTKTRKLTLTIPIKSALGAKCSYVTQIYTLRSCSEEGKLYSIDIVSRNEGIPYADAFDILVHHCLVRTVDDHTMFSVYAQVKFKKSLWGIIKGLIEKNTWDGLEEYYSDLEKSIQNKFNIPPAKGKRNRRVTLPMSQIPKEDPHPMMPNNYTGKNPNTSKRNSIISLNQPKTNKKMLTWFIVILLAAVIISNIILMIKLWALESDTANDRFSDFAILYSSPRTTQDWLKILKQQETLHKAEILKWQQVLDVSIKLLKSTEQTLADLLHYVILKETNSSSSNEK